MIRFSRVLRGTRDVLATVAASVDMARAVDAGRLPEARTFDRLGIDREAFARVRR